MLCCVAVPLDYDDDKQRRSRGGASALTVVSAAAAAAANITLPIAKPQTAEEKRKCIKTLIERIPTAKAELFTYPLEWRMVDAVSGAGSTR